MDISLLNILSLIAPSLLYHAQFRSFTSHGKSHIIMFTIQPLLHMHFAPFLDLYLGLQKPGVQHPSFIGLPAAPLAAWSSVWPKIWDWQCFSEEFPNNQVPNASIFCNHHHYYHASTTHHPSPQTPVKGGEHPWRMITRCPGAHFATSLSKSSLPLSYCFSSSWEGSPSTLISQLSHWSCFPYPHILLSVLWTIF